MRQLIRDEVGHALKEHLAEVPISFPAVAAAGDNSDKCTDAPGPTEAADGAADITHRIMRKASQAEQPEDVIGVHTAAEALRELMKHSNKSEKSLVKSSYRRILSLLRHWNEIEEPQ